MRSIIALSLSICCATLARGTGWVLTDSSAREGNPICVAIEEHINRLEPRAKVALAHGDPAVALQKIRKGGLLRSPYKKTFHDQDVPTQVVKMNLPAELRAQMVREMLFAQKVEKVIKRLVNTTATGYNPISLEFDNAVLVHPSCIKFMEQNYELVKEIMPSMGSCQCNFFRVDTKAQVYGFHHASQMGIELGLLAESELYTEKHMSFRTALTPANISANPFTMFDGETPAVYNVEYMAKDILENMREGVLPAERESLMWLSVAASSPAINYPSLSVKFRRTVMDYADNLYMWSKHCSPKRSSDPSDPVLIGTHWDLEVGEALHFNNWRHHSDGALGDETYPRWTADLRCYSESRVPFPFKDQLDFSLALIPPVAHLRAVAPRCVTKLFNYDLEAAYKKPISYGVGDIGAGFIGEFMQIRNKELQQILSEYYVHVQRVHDADSPNYTAFMECWREGEAFADDVQKHWRTHPQFPSYLLRFYNGTRLFIAFAVLLGRANPLAAVAVIAVASIVGMLLMRACAGRGSRKAKSA